MIYKSELQADIYKLERQVRELTDALVYAGVFSYDQRAVYQTQYGRILINEVKSK